MTFHCPTCQSALAWLGVDGRRVVGLWWCENCQSHALGTPPRRMLGQRDATEMVQQRHWKNALGVREFMTRWCDRTQSAPP